MRCDVLAVGTELLLGHVVDTNSTWIGEQLAAVGIDTFEHRKVGDNLERVAGAVRAMLAEADAVIVCGGLGPTADDITRDAIAVVMGVPLERRDEIVEHIRGRFAAAGLEMSPSNLRQAEVPAGGGVMRNPIGTAPGLCCVVDGPDGAQRVIYAVPGVPHEMRQMITDLVIPDLIARSGARSVIVSRSLKTWGTSESALGEMIAARVDAQSNPTIAFLAREIEGLWVRMTAKAPTEADARALIDVEERALREILGDLVFGVDDETMEHAVIERLRSRGWTLAIAESVTGGLVSARLVDTPGASQVLRGAVVSYATDVKRSVLGVTAEHVVSKEAAEQMAEGVRTVLGADVGLAVTGVAGPTTQEGIGVGTVWFGLALPGVPAEAVGTQLPGDRNRLRQFATISALDLVRLRLDALG